MNYQKPDTILENEKITFCKYLKNNFEDKVFNEGMQLKYCRDLGYVDNKVFKTYFLVEKSISKNNLKDLERIRLTGNSIKEIIVECKGLGLTYLVIEGDQFFNKYLNDAYEDENKYSYLERSLLLKAWLTKN